VTYDRGRALELADALRGWRQNSARAAAEQLRDAVAEVDRLTQGQPRDSRATPQSKAPRAERSVDELDLSVRACNVLAIAEIRTLGDLIQRTEDEVRKLKGSSAKVVKEIKQELALVDLALAPRASLK
jgi:DNA-directed RNA polymerase subunit alpha